MARGAARDAEGDGPERGPPGVNRKGPGRKAGALPWSLYSRWLLQRQDLDVLVLDLVAVVLQVDLALGLLRVGRHLRPLALGDLGVPVLAPDLRLANLLAVEPMLEMVALGNDLRMVPLAGRLHDLLGRRIDGIDRAGRGERVLAVAVLVVVGDLVLGAGLVGGAPRLGDAVHDAAVAARGDLPVDLELEVAELL